MTKKFEYKKFREPRRLEVVQDYLKEFMEHMESEFERFVDTLQDESKAENE